jgi:plasmid maintenance system antidote protein VapI
MKYEPRFDPELPKDLSEKQLTSTYFHNRQLPKIEMTMARDGVVARVVFYFISKKDKKIYEKIYLGPQQEIYKICARQASRIGLNLERQFNNVWNTTFTEVLNQQSKKNSDKLNLELNKNKYSIYDTFRPAQMLTQKLEESGMAVEDLANLSDVNKTTIFRHLKDEFEISRDIAIKYAKALGCDPAEILFNDLYVNIWGSTDTISGSLLKRVRVDTSEITASKYLGMIKCPREIYRADVKAIRIDSPHSHLHNLIAFYYSSDETKKLENTIVVVGANIKDRSDGNARARYFIGIYKTNRNGKTVDLHTIDSDTINLEGVTPDEDFNSFEDVIDQVSYDKIVVQDLDPFFVAPVVSFIDPSKLYSKTRVDVQKKYKEIYTDNRIDEDLNYKNFKEIQKMSYLKQKLEDYLKDIDTDDMETLLLRNQIKTLIEVSSGIQDTIGRAAYGEVKFERKIKPLKDFFKPDADFTPEELTKLNNRFDEIIEKANTLRSIDESNA